MKMKWALENVMSRNACFVSQLVGIICSLVLFTGCVSIYVDEVSPSDNSDVEKAKGGRLSGMWRVAVDGCEFPFSSSEMVKVLRGRLVDANSPCGLTDELGLQVNISCEKSVDETGVIVGCFTLLILPAWETTTYDFKIEIIGSSTEKRHCELKAEETLCLSWLPWSYLPVLWHQKGRITFEEGDAKHKPAWRWIEERIADEIVRQLDEDFYMTARYGREEFERMKRQNEEDLKVLSKTKQLECERKERAVEDARIERLRKFALAEAPVIWETYQSFSDEVKSQKNRISHLEQTLKDFDRNPEQDADYKALKGVSEEMQSTLKSLRHRLEEAYLAYRKFQTTPGEKGSGEMVRKILRDGVQEAESAKARFDEMRKSK